MINVFLYVEQAMQASDDENKKTNKISNPTVFQRLHTSLCIRAVTLETRANAINQHCYYRTNTRVN